MLTLKKIFLFILCSKVWNIFCYKSLADQFKSTGYLEIYDQSHSAKDFDNLYAYFDQLINFLRNNDSCAHKLQSSKERFIRSKECNYYSTNFFGLCGELKKTTRHQISFYYSVHFHEFVLKCFPEFHKVQEIVNFFQACYKIQESYQSVFAGAAAALNLENIFTCQYGKLPILFKVVRYDPHYTNHTAHYDGTAFSLFLDSTINQALLLAPYKAALTVNDFCAPHRKYARDAMPRSILLIPGTFLAEFSIYPTPHIVTHSGKERYATIALAMRPNYIQHPQALAILPEF